MPFRPEPFSSARLALENPLADALESRREELGRACCEAMYQDPFWMDRYGPRGRQFADEDAQHHVHALAEALRQDDSAPLVRYALWLRSLLVARGMCTAHIEETFARLERAIDASGIEHPARARELLGAARAALLYPEGPERALQLAAAALERRIAARARAALPALAGRRFAQAPATLLSYLADALAAGDAQLFARHAAWSQGFAARRGGPNGELPALLDALERELPPPLAAAARPALRAARKALEAAS